MSVSPRGERADKPGSGPAVLDERALRGERLMHQRLAEAARPKRRGARLLTLTPRRDAKRVNATRAAVAKGQRPKPMRSMDSQRGSVDGGEARGRLVRAGLVTGASDASDRRKPLKRRAVGQG